MTIQPARLDGDTMLIQDGQSLIAYAPFSGAIARLEGTTSCGQEERAILSAQGFFGALPKHLAAPAPDHFSSLTLLLTRRCNLACVYCYAKATAQGQTMPHALAAAATDFYLNQLLGDRIRICFHGGGEPTLAMGLIKAVVAQARTQAGQKKVVLLMTTNGTAPAETFDWLMDNQFNLSLSIDGAPQIQNCNRPTIDQQPSSPLVERTIRQLVTASYPFVVRLTYAGGDDLAATLKYFAELGIRKVHLEPLFPYGRVYSSGDEAIRESAVPRAPSGGELARQFMETLVIAEQYHMVVYNSHVMNLTRGSGFFCSSIGGQALIVTHDGLLSGCLEVVDGADPDRDRFCYGRWNRATNEFWVDTDRHHVLQQRHADRLPTCAKCFARYACAGGCAVKAVRQQGNWLGRDIPYCVFTKTVLPEIIKRIARLSGV